MCGQLHLQPRGAHGEHSCITGDTDARYDVSNKQRLGYSEVQLVQKLIDGVTKIIEMEEMLARGATPQQVREQVRDTVTAETALATHKSHQDVHGVHDVYSWVPCDGLASLPVHDADAEFECRVGI